MGLLQDIVVTARIYIALLTLSVLNLLDFAL